MVCSRGESLTLHISQMKLLNAIAAAAVIGGSFLIPVPAEAKNGWVNVGSLRNGETHYVKPLGGNWPYRMYINGFSSGEDLKAEADCKRWRTRWVNADGSREPWKDVMPGSFGESKVEVACR